MPVVTVVVTIAAPPERCFDLARSVDAHVASTSRTGERAVGGVTSGLMALGDEVTWSARHFGIRQRLTSRITRYDRPHSFRDSMVRGAFARLDHDHLFEAADGATRMTDRLDFDAPLGPLGRLAEALFLTSYMERFLRSRALVLKALAESDEWRRFVAAS